MVSSSKVVVMTKLDNRSLNGLRALIVCLNPKSEDYNVRVPAYASSLKLDALIMMVFEFARPENLFPANFYFSTDC